MSGPAHVALILFCVWLLLSAAHGGDTIIKHELKEQDRCVVTVQRCP